MYFFLVTHLVAVPMGSSIGGIEDTITATFSTSVGTVTVIRCFPMNQ